MSDSSDYQPKGMRVTFLQRYSETSIVLIHGATFKVFKEFGQSTIRDNDIKTFPRINAQSNLDPFFSDR